MTDLKEKLKHLPSDKIARLELITDKIIETGLDELTVKCHTVGYIFLYSML